MEIVMRFNLGVDTQDEGREWNPERVKKVGI